MGKGSPWWRQELRRRRKEYESIKPEPFLRAELEKVLMEVVGWRDSCEGRERGLVVAGDFNARVG